MNNSKTLTGGLSTSSLVYDMSDSSVDESEYSGFDASSFLGQFCQQVDEKALDIDHSANFRLLTRSLVSKSTDELTALYSKYNSICELAG